MATYVVSDIHGEYDTLMALLNKISFSEADTLYILGDVVDRGREGVKILQYVMETENVKFILGNHEYMCMQYFKDDCDETIRRRWNRNGNFYTLYGFDEISAEEKEKILSFIEECPDKAEITVNGQDFYLVHGFYGENKHDRVWNRPKMDTVIELPNNAKIIVGHTPVVELYVKDGGNEDHYVYSRELTNRGEFLKILHAEGFIDIDCSVGYGLSAARLACLRLDDMAEFYQEVIKN